VDTPQPPGILGIPGSLAIVLLLDTLGIQAPAYLVTADTQDQVHLAIRGTAVSPGIAAPAPPDTAVIQVGVVAVVWHGK
jgi:hypothetical protein